MGIYGEVRAGLMDETHLPGATVLIGSASRCGIESVYLKSTEKLEDVTCPLCQGIVISGPRREMRINVKDSESEAHVMVYQRPDADPWLDLHFFNGHYSIADANLRYDALQLALELARIWLLQTSSTGQPAAPQEPEQLSDPI